MKKTKMFPGAPKFGAREIGERALGDRPQGELPEEVSRLGESKMGDLTAGEIEVDPTIEGEIPNDVGRSDGLQMANQTTGQIKGAPVQKKASATTQSLVKPAGAPTVTAAPPTAPTPPAGTFKMARRVMLIPPKSLPYPSDPSRIRHDTDWQIFDADSKQFLYGNADESIARSIINAEGAILV
ncbi:hypothetical protein [Lysobacter capsici]|uniref:hypothetical protein n=1 Tax=Lysobacter capsici TaxID=435897 RepID=UPI0012FD972D|nr:hypothetical protein [Lysobacter capsici]